MAFRMALDFLPAVKDWMAEAATRRGNEGMELVSMREGSGLRLRWCAVVWVKENLLLQQHTGHPKQPVGNTA